MDIQGDSKAACSVPLVAFLVGGGEAAHFGSSRSHRDPSLILWP